MTPAHTLSNTQQIEFDGILEKAVRCLSNAYVPYENFPVACVIRATNGEFFSGVNVQNAAFPQGFCAEGSAIAAMVTAGQYVIDKLLVVSSSKQLCPPCGGCRQCISEFATPTTLIALANTDRIERVHTIDQLLPLCFNSENIST